MTAALPEFVEQIIGSDDPYALQLDGTKIGFSWWQERVEAWRRGERIAPITMDIAFTRRCQAACNFCYAQLQANDGQDVSEKAAFEFLEDAAAIGVKGVSLISDGESTGVPYYAKAIQFAHSLGIKIGISTNGIALTPDVLEKIMPCLTYLRFNFSGGDKKRWAEIMGVKQALFDRVVGHIKTAMEIKRRDGLSTNVNGQFVVMPKDFDQIVPFAKLFKEIRTDYAILKHTATNEENVLGVDYSQYEKLFPLFQEAEALSDDTFRVAVKWSRLKNEGKRDYQRCFGTPFLLQMSGSGLIAPCGQWFNSKYEKFHLGNINETRFRDIYQSDRYWDVINYLGSDSFDATKSCGENCLQTNTNSWLSKWVDGKVQFNDGPAPPHMEFL